MNKYLKLLQRRLFTFLNTSIGCSIVVIGVFVLLYSFIAAGSSECGFSALGVVKGSSDCWRDPFKDNIGGVNVRPGLAYDPIDVVYTWVNGSDPVWLKKMHHWRSMLHQPEIVEAEDLNATSGNATANETSTEEDTHSLNRYRDSNELKFSLRSLQMYAPWIHKIYIVTDNQVPNWLNTMDPRIQMVRHSDIFENASHLPVFSSPAIEAHLHRIPGLTKKFVYFNDDVMLGKSVLPEDFTSVSGVQKFYFAWDVPKCAPGCSDSWIGDGYCDRACNVSSCNFDYPDCVNASSAPTRQNRYDSRINTAMCAKGCPETWVADKTCDNKCKNAACGWDIGDCGLDLLAEGLPHVSLSMKNVFFSMSNEGGTHENVSSVNDTTSVTAVDTTPTDSGEKGTSEDTAAQQPPLVLTIENGTTAVYFNMSFLPCQARFDQSVPCKHNFSYSAASYTADEGLVHLSILLNKHDILGVLLFHGQEGAPEHPGFPKDVEFAVKGLNSVTEMSVEIKFRIRIVADDEERLARMEYEGVPSDMNPLNGRCAACPETTELDDFVYAHGNPIVMSKLHSQPFLSRIHPLGGVLPGHQTDQHDEHSGAVVQLSLNPHILDRVEYDDLGSSAESRVQIGDEVLGNIFVRQTITSPQMPVLQSVVPLCSALARHSESDSTIRNSESGWFHPMFLTTSASREKCHETTLRSFLKSSDNLNSLNAIKPKPKFPNVLFSIDADEEKEQEPDESVHNSLLLLLFLPQNYTSRHHVTAINNQSSTNQTVSHKSDQRWFQSKVEFFRFHNAVGKGTNDDSRSPYTEAAQTLFALHETTVGKSTANELAAKVVAGGLVGRSSQLKGTRFACMLSNVRWKYGSVLAMNATNTSDENSAVVDELRTGRRLTVVETKPVTKLVRFVDDEGDYGFQGAKQVSGKTKSKSMLPLLQSSKYKKIAVMEKLQASRSVKSTGKPRRWGMRSFLESYNAAGESKVFEMHSSSVEELPHQSSLSNLLDVVADLTTAAHTALVRIFGWNNEQDRPQSSRRLTTDTYGQSLIHVNRLYQKAFGSENRKVPAHLPHLIDSTVMDEMQDMFKEEWMETSSHKFRSPKDMQYAFSYYYYVMNRNKAKPPSLQEYVTREVDTNHDGYLDSNEFLTLASLVAGRSPKESEIKDYYECTFRRGEYSNLSHSYNESGVRHLGSLATGASDRTDEEKLIRKKVGAAAIRKIEKAVKDKKAREAKSGLSQGSDVGLDPSIDVTTISSNKVSGGTFELSSTVKRHPSVEEVLGCPHIVTELRDRVAWPVTYTAGTDKDIAFEMIGDNYTESYSQLNSIRARKPKFVCINDNMKNPPEQLMKAFEDFFDAMYPFPSRFELPEGQINPSLYTDEMMAIQSSLFTKVKAVIFNFLSLGKASVLILKSTVVDALDLLINILDGGDHTTGVYVMLRRPTRANARDKVESRESSSSHLSGWVSTHNHGYEASISGATVHTVSISLPFSFLVVSIVIAVLILWISRDIRRRQHAKNSRSVAYDSTSISQPTIDPDEVAKLDGVTAPKLAVAASVEKAVTTSTRATFNANRFRPPSKDESEDFLNKLWRKAGYGGELPDTPTEAETETEAAPEEQAEQSWEDKEIFFGDGLEDAQRQDSSESNEDTTSSAGMDDSMGSPSAGYEHGILKKGGSDSGSAKKKSVRFTKIEGEVRPRVTSLPGRLMSALQHVTGKGQAKETALSESPRPKKELHED